MKNFKLAAVLVLFTFAACTITSTGNSNAAATTNENMETAVNASSTPISAGGQITAASPESVVAELYKLHDAQKGPFFQTKDRKLVDRFFTKPFADMIWKANHGPEGEVGAIDFDPLYDGQDFEIKNLKFSASGVTENSATVMADFLNFGEKRSVTHLMKMVDGAWKIDDIKYQQQGTLMEALKDYYAREASTEKPGSSATGFEGKYTVGTTSCTVTPSKMSFEIKWAKGSGTEMFYSAGNNSFESEEGKNGVNRFEFTDETFNTGLFFRGDGKTFPVNRAK